MSEPSDTARFKPHDGLLALNCQIVGPNDLIKSLRAEVDADADADGEIKVLNSGVLHDPNYLSLDLVTMGTLTLAVYSAAFAPLIPLIWKSIKKSPKASVEIRTAWKTIRIEADEITEEHLVKLVHSLTTPKRRD